ncbi:hypothetical protein I5E68_16790 [Novosphingobium sp. YJ-S2-02]|uniref:Glycosyl hydrolase family 79 n=1 Tax=Novosphingobium aureum TaxID=2792964 RepID=A0A931MLZ7_9SPHN|nr:hypothetical protein [Novosphingobium aureum]
MASPLPGRLLPLLVGALLSGCAGQHVPGSPADGAAPARKATEATLRAGSLPLVGRVSERFLSYNVEMVELTGGRFWKPYRNGIADKADQYEYRPPIDLANPRLRKLAGALAPVYVRYSGTWANATVYADVEHHDGPAPEGFDAVLTRAQWRGAIDFAKAVDARIVTSMATSAGTRDADGAWQPDHAASFLAATKALGGTIWASEFANEPNLVGGTQPPEGYSAADYRRDYARFHTWLAASSPETQVMAPGAFEFGAGRALPAFIKQLPTEQLVPDDATRPDIVSFHFYGEISQRCAGTRPDPQAAQWLDMLDGAIANTMRLRARVAPEAPVWLSETAETACGGNPQAAGFADSFRFVDQLANAARQGVEVSMHNTLAASDYALLDEHSFAPRPNYWAALLWRKTMGTGVLDARSFAPDPNLRLYAHCQRAVAGGVTLLAVNLGRETAGSISLAGQGQVQAYTLSAVPGDAQRVALGGKPLALAAGDALPALEGEAHTGAVPLPASSITFITIPGAANPACSGTAQ